MTPTGGICPNDFSDPIACSELEKVVSEWRSVIAVLGNVPDMVSYPGTVASLKKHN